jgi:uncharacterized membrane protein
LIPAELRRRATRSIMRVSHPASNQRRIGVTLAKTGISMRTEMAELTVEEAGAAGGSPSGIGASSQPLRLDRLAPAPALAALAEVEKPTEVDPPTESPGPPLAAAAPLIKATPPPPPAAIPSSHEAPRVIDPMLAGFDYVVALAGYVLLFVGVFMAGVPALATFALAYAHRRDSHLLVRTHFQFQLRIFFTALLFVGLGAGSLVAAGGLALSRVVRFAHDHLPGLAGAMSQAHVDAWTGAIAAALLAAAIVFFGLTVIWLLGASLFGFLRLVAGRPIGHRPAV